VAHLFQTVVFTPDRKILQESVFTSVKKESIRYLSEGRVEILSSRRLTEPLSPLASVLWGKTGLEYPNEKLDQSAVEVGPRCGELNEGVLGEAVRELPRGDPLDLAATATGWDPRVFDQVHGVSPSK
jgi:hypothetical protein